MLSTRGRSSCNSRPRFVLPSAASNATGGRESMTCMAFRQDFSIEVGWGVQTCRIVFSEAICGIGTHKRRVFKNEILKVSGSALAAEISTGSHNRLLRRQHCSSLCSQSEGHEHVANMTSALEHDFVGFSARAGPPQSSPPSLCEQSELQCFAPEFRRTLLFSKKRRFF